MTKFKDYKINIGGNVKLYLPGVTPPSGFKPSDILASIQLEGTFDGTVEVKDAKVEMLKLASEFVPMVIAEIPTLVNNGLGYMERSLAPASSSSGAKVSGNMAIVSSADGQKGKDDSDKSGTVVKGAPSSASPIKDNPAVSDGEKKSPSVQPPVSSPVNVDQELAKVMAVLAKVHDIKPYNKLTFANPVGDDNAYIGLLMKAKDWNGKKSANQPGEYVTIAKYLNSGNENYLIRHWKDISDIIYELRRERPAPIFFDDWKIVMEYLFSKGWYTKTGENYYQPVAYPGYTPKGISGEGK